MSSPNAPGAPTATTRWSWEPFRLRRGLPAAADGETYDLHLTAIEYGLATSIAIRGPDDIRSAQHWAGRFDPYEHQVTNLLTFCRRAPVSLIADDVGLGKTISAGLIISELMARNKVERVLVVAPSVLLPQWKEEMESKFGIDAAHGTGKSVRRAIQSGAPVVITTYHTLRNHYETLSKSHFDMIVLDEAHKLRNLHGTGNPPMMATILKKGLAARHFKFVLMLTATPIQNRLWDLYSLVDCLAAARGHVNPFGKPTSFALDYVADAKSNACQLVPESADEFRRILADYMVRRRRADSGLTFPERSVQTQGDVPAPQTVALLEALAPVMREVNALSRLSLAQALMSSPEALVSQLGNMGKKGTVSQARVDELTELAGCIENTGKMRRLLALIEQLATERPDDWRVVVFCTRRSTLDAIGRALSNRSVPVAFIQGGAPESNRAAISDFWASPPRANVLVSTDAGAEGLNLQVANVLVNYDLPWNPMVVEQRIGRIQRLSSAHRHVAIVNLVTRGTVEERIVGRLMEKLQAVSSSLGDVEGILESLSERDEASLEKEIRELVILSLQGRDVEQSVAALQQSIERAKSLYDHEKEEVERRLGSMLELEVIGPEPPQLSATAPRRSVREFASAALRADGGSLAALPTGGWMLERDDARSARVWFDDELGLPIEAALPGSDDTLVFREGRPDFERLVDAWSERDAHHVRDLRGARTPKLKQLAAAWIGSQLPGAEVVGIQRHENSDAFQGTLAVRVAAAVTHDRYEKLVEVLVRPDGHAVLAPEVQARSTPPVDDWLETAPRDLMVIPGDSLLPAAGPPPASPPPLVGKQLKPGDLAPDLEATLRKALLEDDDLRKFCDYYAARLDEELTRAQGRKGLEKHVRRQFEPRLGGEVVGAEGALYTVVDLDVTVRLPNEREFTTRLSVGPALEQVVNPPAMVACEVSGELLPDDQIELCEVTGRHASRHLMAATRSGAWALRDHVVKDRRSGKLVLPHESRGIKVETCAVSGRQARRSQMVQSDVSGAWMLREVAVQSPESRRWCEPALAVRCAWTGLSFLPDEVGTCRVTGLPVVSTRLGPSSLLLPLRSLVLETPPESEDKRLLTWLTDNAEAMGVPALHKALRAWATTSASGDTKAVLVEVPRRMGFGTRKLGLVISETPSRSIVGRVGPV